MTSPKLPSDLAAASGRHRSILITVGRSMRSERKTLRERIGSNTILVQNPMAARIFHVSTLIVVVYGKRVGVDTCRGNSFYGGMQPSVGRGRCVLVGGVLCGKKMKLRVDNESSANSNLWDLVARARRKGVFAPQLLLRRAVIPDVIDGESSQAGNLNRSGFPR